MSSKDLRPNILLSFVLGAIYAAFYDYIVRDYVFTVFDYYVSYRYTQMHASAFLVYLLLCASPLLFYQGVRHLSGAMSFIVYVLAYVPMMNTLFVAGYPRDLSQPYVEVLFISMVLIFVSDGIVIGKKLMSGKHKRLPFVYLEILTLILMGVLLVLNRSRLHFVNILSESDLLYDLREENNQEMRGGMTLYLIGWLKQVFLPILMVAYLHTRQYLKFAVAFGGIVLLFMLDMQKLTIIMPFVITAFYFLYKNHSLFILKYFHAVLIAVMIVFPFLCNAFRDNPLVAGLAFVLIFRTQCIEGVEWNTYFRFFELDPRHPHTWYTHIGIIRKLFGGYPYKGPLGRVVTSGGGNANGIFWLMDGLAAGGPVGIFLSTLFFILFKSFFTAVDFRLDKGMGLCILLFAIASMVNVSLFTAILSCGFLVYFLVICFFDLSFLNVSSPSEPARNKRASKSRRHKKIRIVFGK